MKWPSAESKVFFSPTSRAIRSGFQSGLSFSGSSDSTTLANVLPLGRTVSSSAPFDSKYAGCSSNVVFGGSLFWPYAAASNNRNKANRMMLRLSPLRIY